jgi:hypothetical protein
MLGDSGSDLNAERLPRTEKGRRYLASAGARRFLDDANAFVASRDGWFLAHGAQQVLRSTTTHLRRARDSQPSGDRILLSTTKERLIRGGINHLSCQVRKDVGPRNPAGTSEALRAHDEQM